VTAKKDRGLCDGAQSLPLIFQLREVLRIDIPWNFHRLAIGGTAPQDCMDAPDCSVDSSPACMKPLLLCQLQSRKAISVLSGRTSPVNRSLDYPVFAYRTSGNSIPQ